MTDLLDALVLCKRNSSRQNIYKLFIIFPNIFPLRALYRQLADKCCASIPIDPRYIIIHSGNARPAQYSLWHRAVICTVCVCVLLPFLQRSTFSLTQVYIYIYSQRYITLQNRDRLFADLSVLRRDDFYRSARAMMRTRERKDIGYFGV